MAVRGFVDRPNSETLDASLVSVDLFERCFVVEVDASAKSFWHSRLRRKETDEEDGT
jgi:hypothetical protein